MVMMLCDSVRSLCAWTTSVCGHRSLLKDRGDTLQKAEGGTDGTDSRLSRLQHMLHPKKDRSSKAEGSPKIFYCFPQDMPQ